MLKTSRFYRTTQNHALLESDRSSPEPKEGGKVIAVIPLGSLVFVTKIARFRYVQVIYRDTVGYIWLYTNLCTMSLLEQIETEEDMNMDSLATVKRRQSKK